MSSKSQKPARAESDKSPRTVLVNVLPQKLNVNIVVDGRQRHVELKARQRFEIDADINTLGPDVRVKVDRGHLRYLATT